MTVLGIWAAGLRRVGSAPALLLLLWLASVTVTVAPAVAMHDRLVAQFDESLEADRAEKGTNFDWMQEFRAQADPLGRTLRPDVIGFAAVMANTSGLSDLDMPAVVVGLSSLAFAAALWFLTPGLVLRLAASRPIHASGLLATSGAFAVRWCRLAVVTLLTYGLLLTSLHPWLFDDVFDAATRNMTVERTGFAIRLALYVVFFLIVGAVNLLFDVTKIRLVVEDRRSIVGSLTAAARFIRANRRVAVGAYAMNALTFALVLGLYALLAPGAGSAGWDAWAAFVVGQLYIVLRLGVKLSFWASDVVLLERRFSITGVIRAAASP